MISTRNGAALAGSGETGVRADRVVVTRREVLKKGLICAAGIAYLPAVLAACNSMPAPTPTPTDFLARKLGGSLKLGSFSYTDPGRDAAMKEIDSAFAAVTGLSVTPSLIDHNTFADPLGQYIPYQPDDLFTWIFGYRMRAFAAKGLISPIDDVWALVSDNFPPGFAQVVSNDGHVYGIPTDFYPWCVLYRKSLWAAKGYTVPTTWDEFLTLCGKMKTDGLTPIAFSDRDGWPAMGTFDILNLRLNGYDFHMGLLSGKEMWADPRVTAVFEAWRKLIPFYTPGFTTLSWQQGTDALITKKAGMTYMGLFVTSEFDTIDPTGAAKADIDFFPFPLFGNDFDAERAIEAPVDAWVMCSKSPTLAVDLDNAKAYLEFWARGSTQLLLHKANSGYIPTASDTDLSALDPLSRKAIPLVREAKRITQFMDRDTRPDFAGAGSMQLFLLRFLENPDQDLAALEKSIQDFWDVLPPYAGLSRVKNLGHFRA